MPEPVLRRSIQTSDIPFSKVPTPKGEVGYLFSRSFDSFVHETEGQDYFVFQDGDDKFCFVLCDGVGQSYCGQLAARLLGEHLFNWLENLDVDLLSNPDLPKHLTDYLNNFSREAQEEVNRDPLPETMPDLLLLALTDQKEYGSEAVFVAGRIDFPEGNSPLLHLFWLGDSQVHLFDKRGLEIEIPGKWVNSERWSTKRGIRGAEVVNHWTSDLRRVKKIVAHSDGMKSEALVRLFALTDNIQKMRSEVEKLRSLPTSDDVSLISFDLPGSNISLCAFFIPVKSLLISKLRIFFLKARFLSTRFKK